MSPLKHLGSVENVSKTSAVMLQIQNVSSETMSTSRSVGMTASFAEKTYCFLSCYTLTSQSLGFLKLRDQWRHHGDVETICGLVHQPSFHALKETAADSCLLDLPPGSVHLAEMWRTLDISWGFSLVCDCDIVCCECHRNSLFSS